MRTTRRLAGLATPIAAALLVWCLGAGADEKPALEAVLGDNVGAGWIYDDIDAGYAKARESGKPLLIAFR